MKTKGGYDNVCSDVLCMLARLALPGRAYIVML